MKQIVSNSPRETEEVVKTLLSKLDFKNHKPVALLLKGELGGGKTTFVKAMAKNLGIEEIITSPTFIIFNSYKTNPKFEALNSKQIQSTNDQNTKLKYEIISSKQIQNPNFQNSKLDNLKKLVHFDLYRIESDQELEEINFFDQIDANSLVCIEWPENMSQGYLDRLAKMAEVIEIKFEYGQKLTERKISLV